MVIADALFVLLGCVVLIIGNWVTVPFAVLLIGLGLVSMSMSLKVISRNTPKSLTRSTVASPDVSLDNTAV